MEERIISSGDNYIQVRMNTIIQTHNIFVTKLKDYPNSTIDMSLYCKDIGFMIHLINQIEENLKGKNT